jgi:hypothetical protein
MRMDCVMSYKVLFITTAQSGSIRHNTPSVSSTVVDFETKDDAVEAIQALDKFKNEFIQTKGIRLWLP